MAPAPAKKVSSKKQLNPIESKPVAKKPSVEPVKTDNGKKFPTFKMKYMGASDTDKMSEQCASQLGEFQEEELGGGDQAIPVARNKQIRGEFEEEELGEGD